MPQNPRLGIEALEIIGDALQPPVLGAIRGVQRTVACEIDEHLAAAGFTIVKSVPVDQWEIVVDEPVLIYVAHQNAKYEPDEKKRREEWEAWCVGRWIKHNKGGWTWYGLCGQVTHVTPLPERPR
jgi:hypothetical protein